LNYTVSAGTVTVKVDGNIVPKMSGDSLDVLSDGAHTVRVEAVNGAGKTGFAEVTFTVDTVPPTVSMDPVTSPTNTNSQTITGSMESGATVTVSVNTTATPGLVSYPTTTTWNCTVTGLNAGANGITVTARDAAGNSATAMASITLVSLTIANVAASTNTINTAASESSTIFFTIYAPGTVTLKVIPEKLGPAGAPVYQTSQVCPAAGTYLFTWDGRNSTGQVVPDEAYLYTLTATDGVNTTSYSPSQPTGTGSVSCTPAASYNPYNNTPLTINYTLSQPARINVSIPLGVDTVKILDAVPGMTGSYTVDWDGRNASGNILPLIIHVGCEVSSLLRENCIITSGDTPKITAVRTDPYQMSLSYGQFTRIKYSLSRDANVTVKLISPTGATTTLINNEYQASGAHEFEWNGADASDTTGKKFLTTGEGDYAITIQAVNPTTGSSSLKKGSLKIGY
jgi:flagellar hook assembly protein FlgD